MMMRKRLDSVEDFARSLLRLTDRINELTEPVITVFGYISVVGWCGLIKFVQTG
jgi:hypothetical protein